MAAAVALTLATPVIAQPPQVDDRAVERIRAHVTFLADDLLEGREAGTRGFDIAAAYVASQLAQLGVKPAGTDGSYFQIVPMTAFRPADPGRLVLKSATGDQILVFGEDYVPDRNPLQAEMHLSAPVVFVGYGVVGGGRDDYAGLDVKGKIVAAISGGPPGLQSEERAYYASGRTKRAEAEKRGAVGFISLLTPADERRQPFSNHARQYDSWRMTWRDASGALFSPGAGTPQVATLSVAGAAKLFAGASRTYDEVAAEAEAGAPLRFVLPTRLEVALRTETKAVESANVLGMIEGSDPALRSEALVLSAHLDHIGITAPVNGDAINNGALDNAAGVATTLEVARAFVEGKPPRRTLIFLLNTAEEKGLVGADYYARNPTTPHAIVANVNLDMPILTYDFTDVIAFGAERSNLGPAVQRAAARMNIKLSPDPLPEEGLFTRSDHFRFVEQGVPAVFLMTGFENGGEAAFASFLRNNYHKPSDDLSQPIRYDAGAKFAQINYEIARELADGEVRPAWNAGDFFGTLFGKPAQGPQGARRKASAPAIVEADGNPIGLGGVGGHFVAQPALPHEDRARLRLQVDEGLGGF